MIMMRQTRSVLRSVQLRITHSQTELSSVFDGSVVVEVGWVAITERLAEDAVVHEDFYPKKRKRRKSVQFWRNSYNLNTVIGSEQQRTNGDGEIRTLDFVVLFVFFLSEFYVYYLFMVIIFNHALHFDSYLIPSQFITRRGIIPGGFLLNCCCGMAASCIIIMS